MNTEAATRFPMECTLELADAQMVFIFLERPRYGTVDIVVEIRTGIEGIPLVMKCPRESIYISYLRMLNSYLAKYITDIYKADPVQGLPILGVDTFITYESMFTMQPRGGSVDEGGFRLICMVKPTFDNFGFYIGVENNVKFQKCEEFLTQLRGIIISLEQMD